MHKPFSILLSSFHPPVILHRPTPSFLLPPHSLYPLSRKADNIILTMKITWGEWKGWEVSLQHHFTMCT